MKKYKFDRDNKSFLATDNIAIIVAYFYKDIADDLLQGAVDTLQKYGIKDDNIEVFYVPGAFEIPLMCQKIAKSPHHYDGIITLGAVIRGETPHFDYVCNQCAKGVSKVSLMCNIPISFGVLTTDNMAQTKARAGGIKGNKGVEAAIATIEMIYLLNNSNIK